jgi:hypothetical protein
MNIIKVALASSGLVCLAMVAEAEESRRPWAGPMGELRFGQSVTKHDFGLVTEDGNESFAFGDQVTLTGLKVGWRFPIGNRLTFGPMLAYYGKGLSSSVDGAYLPEQVTGSLSYHETRSVTAGLQFGLDIGRGWFAYGELGYVGQEILVNGTLSVALEQMSIAETGYLVGTYREVGISKEFGKNTYGVLALQERVYGDVYSQTDGTFSGSRTERTVFLGVGMQF